MKQFKKLIFGAILGLCTFAASAQVLWQTASYGMTVAQIEKAFPEAKEPSEKPGVLGTGAIELLTIQNISLANRSFKASFYFKNKKLDQVTLTLTESLSYQVALGTFENLADSLRAKYGKETSKKNSQGLLEMSEINWMAGRTNINLFLLAVAKNPATLNINYQVRTSKDAEKL